jgi:hypothetical protein
MKRMTLALLVAAGSLTVTAARADTRISFGLSLGVPTYVPSAPVVACPPPPALASPPPLTVVYAPAAPRGHWEDVTVKTWVPERWTYGRDRWGRSVRVLEPGYYSYRTDRVWVETPLRPHHPGHAPRAYAWNR